MQPDWSTAPDWANYWALDTDGFFWFENKPEWDESWLCWVKGGRTELNYTCQLIKDSLQQRPS